jgi:type II secretory pathway pseudopilin PulG
MSVVSIVLLVLLAVVVLLFVGGYVANARRLRAESEALHAQAQEADHLLADAHAEDKGWDRSTLEAAARRVHAERHGGDPRRLTLVQVVDRPGTEDDQAVFDADGVQVRLGRRGDDWIAL